jgi:transposase
VLHEQLGILHRRVLAVVRDDEVCRRLMTIPGVGPVVALTYRVTAVRQQTSARRPSLTLAV